MSESVIITNHIMLTTRSKTPVVRSKDERIG